MQQLRAGAGWGDVRREFRSVAVEMAGFGPLDVGSVFEVEGGRVAARDGREGGERAGGR